MKRFECYNSGLGVKKILKQQVKVPTFTYGTRSWGLRETEKRSLNVFKMESLRPIVEVTRWDRAINNEIWKTVGKRQTLTENILSQYNYRLL